MHRGELSTYGKRVPDRRRRRNNGQGGVRLGEGSGKALAPGVIGSGFVGNARRLKGLVE